MKVEGVDWTPRFRKCKVAAAMLDVGCPREGGIEGKGMENWVGKKRGHRSTWKDLLGARV